MKRNPAHVDGFTLIELSIVLVIIGLIVGGVLVGQDLIRAAGVRATITQIEKYNTAANTFREKYGYLPGDIPDPAASSFGFQARGSCPGEGDGNGIITGSNFSICTAIAYNEDSGESVMFWADLSIARLIDGTFNTASSTAFPGAVTFTSTPSVPQLFPAAKIGRGNFIYVYAGYTSPAGLNGYNYFGLSAITGVPNTSAPTSNPALTVQEAYAIDTKMDDGLPQNGRVTAQYLGQGGPVGFNTSGLPNALGPGNGTNAGATQGAATTCYDNGNSNGAIQHYSIEISNGSNVTCALTFQIQAGD